MFHLWPQYRLPRGKDGAVTSQSRGPRLHGGSTWVVGATREREHSSGRYVCEPDLVLDQHLAESQVHHNKKRTRGRSVEVLRKGLRRVNNLYKSIVLSSCLPSWTESSKPCKIWFLSS